MAPGYCYICTRTGERHAVKAGYTCSESPEHYMNTEYSRTIHQLEILACQSVANAELSEKTVGSESTDVSGNGRQRT